MTPSGLRKSVSSEVMRGPKKIVYETEKKRCSKSDAGDVAIRGKWTSQSEFLLSCLGYAAGIGNVWRFPYLCHKNGGGAFLMPYTLMLVICGLPLLYLELSLGQYHGKGPHIIFKNMAPLFHGLGYAMLTVTALVSIYNNMIISWTIFYMFASFSSRLGWESCGNEWNSVRCFSIEQNKLCESNNLTYWNNTCSDADYFCRSLSNFVFHNVTHCLNENGTAVATSKATERTSPSEDYYLHHVLEMSTGGFDKLHEFRWPLVLCLLLVWTVIALCLIKGVRSSGKVVYFTSVFPYAVLIILLIRGVTLDGAVDGIYYYIVPKWEKLGKIEVWSDAAVQVFYSFGPGFGGLLTLSSYNSFKNNCQRDAVVVGITTFAISIVAGFAIFSILGFMAKSLDVKVEDVIKSGPGLIFMVYPEAISKMPLSQLWSFLLFLMLITLGLNSEFAFCQTLITAVRDQWPKLRRWNHYLAIIICLLGFAAGLPLCTKSGIYLFVLFDTYATGWSLLSITLVEVAVVAWIYGMGKYKLNVQEMLKKPPNVYWTVTWKYLAPVTILGILTSCWANYTPVGFGDYKFPYWANVIGWLIGFLSVILIPTLSFYEICVSVKKGIAFQTLLQPTKEWGPAEQNLRLEQHENVPETENGTPSLTPSSTGYHNEAYS